MEGQREGITLCIIAKNEEKNIAKCIASCEHIVDEIIVVDTGSTDYTPKIAASFGAKVIHFPWTNDFSEARNKALENATKEWIIYLDCDEMLDFEDGYRLQEMLETSDKEGYTLLLNNVVNGKVSMACQSLRVLRNRESYRFEGRIHEQIFPSMEKYKGREGVEITDIKFYHYGYDSTLADMMKKSKRNLSLFEHYPEEERDGFYYYNLANEYTRIGDDAHAVTYYRKSIEVGGYDTGYKIFLPIYLTKALHALKRYDEAIDYALKVLEEYETYKDLHFLVVACYFDTGDFRKAKEHLEKYILYSQCDYGYPEFHLNQENDIGALMKQIEDRIVEGEK